jgi:hypothetical protein
LLKLLEQAGAQRRFFVVSDSDDIAPLLRQTLGANRVLEFSRATERAASWKSVQGMVEDLTDMLLLARTGELFASYLSTFGETAWWLGGARARVAVF